jgi:hypothetical protein
MSLLASCPSAKGEFRIWAWSAKAEKLTGFRAEKKEGTDELDTSQGGAALHWSRNGKVVQFIERLDSFQEVLTNEGSSNLGCQEIADSERTAGATN